MRCRCGNWIPSEARLPQRGFTGSLGAPPTIADAWFNLCFSCWEDRVFADRSAV